MVFGLTLMVTASAFGALRKIAVALDEDGAATPSSNPAEQHISNGATLALNGLRPSKLTWINHGKSAVQTLKAIEEINKQKPAIVVGMVDSYQAMLCAERMSPQTFLISPVASSDEILKRDNVLLLGNVNSVQSQLMVQEFKTRAKAGEKVLVAEVLACQNCQNMSGLLSKDLKDAGYQIEIYQVHVSDIVNLGEKKVPEGFQHVVIPADAATAARLVDFFHSKNPKAMFWGASTWGSFAKEIRELPYAKELRGVWLSHYHPDVPTEANAKFVTEFRSKFTAEPTDTAAMFYEGVQLAMMVGQGRDKPIPQILKEVRAYKGLTGTIKIDGKRVNREMVVMELQNGAAKYSKLVKAE